jgi:hypothetical protein
MNKKEISDFGSRLRCLGGRISYPQSYLDKYIDIEKFFLESTIHIYGDDRLAECVENWIHTFGFIISPSKIKNLIKKGHHYDPAALAVFCEIIARTDKKQINISCLKPYFKKKKNITLRNNSKLSVEPKNPDELWSKYNVLTNQFRKNEKKFILDFDFIFKNSPEVYNRIIGIDIVASDYQAYLKKENSNESLRQVSLKIHAHYSNLHKINKRFTALGLAV